jgi:pimeloyl-ACP methyl ester carboxylesterase
LLGLDQPTLLGHSAGGFVALHAALRAPTAFGALILCNTAATLGATAAPDDPTLTERAGPQAAAVAARLFAGDISAEVAEQFAQLVAPNYAGPSHEDVPGHLFPLSPPSLDVMRHFFAHDAHHYDLRARLGEITTRTLVIGGRHDWVCPPSAARTIAAGIPDAELIILDDTGHFPFSEEPDQFRNVINHFLNTLTNNDLHPPMA